ncbi:MAG: hypothetical protein PHE83_19270 [Opitutaceae bacterium]|nr:hypothetical protein [Opitutaceae bacterium]
MSYAWQQAADKEAMAARIPKGKHRVRISRILTGGNDGDFVSRGGDPQIMLILQDQEAREAGQMVTLSDKAGWVLAKIMAACDPPVNLARMEADGIEPSKFADPEFAGSVLLNRELTVMVDWEDAKDGKQYARVTPIRPATAAASEASAPNDAPPAESPPDNPPASAEPPPSEPPPPSRPTVTTKDEAWTTFLRLYRGPQDTQDEKAKRNEKWLAAIRSIGKPETQFTPDDWAEVLARAEVPF